MVSILVVDDDKQERQGVVDHLTPQGYTILEAHGYRAAQKAIEANHVDIVVVDYAMKDANGVELASWIDEKRSGQPPVVMHTSIPSEVIAKLRYKFSGLKEKGIITAVVDKGQYGQIDQAISAIMKRSAPSQSEVEHPGTSEHSSIRHEPELGHSAVVNRQPEGQEI